MSESGTLRDRLLADMKTAMKNRQSLKLQALRLAWSDIKNREIEQKKTLSPDQILSVLQKQVKQYKEAAAQYEQAGRAEGAKEQKTKWQMVQSYLPKSVSEGELKSLIEQAINQLQASSAKQVGQVIKEVRGQARGTVDGALLARLVKERLTT